MDFSGGETLLLRSLLTFSNWQRERLLFIFNDLRRFHSSEVLVCLCSKLVIETIAVVMISECYSCTKRTT